MPNEFAYDERAAPVTAVTIGHSAAKQRLHAWPCAASRVATPTRSSLALKVPPHSVEAEQSLLGALLLDNQAFDRVADLVTGEDFYRDDHRRIWRHIAQADRGDAAGRRGHGRRVDRGERGQGQDRRRRRTSRALAQNTPSALNIRRYAELVRERSVQRRLAQVATEIAESALSPAGKEVGQLLDEAESKIFQIAESGARTRPGPARASSRCWPRCSSASTTCTTSDNPSDVTGVPTGFTDLDQMTAGLQPGDLIIVAGRPSRWARPRFALNIAEHVALHPSNEPAGGDLQHGDGREPARHAHARLDGRVDQHKLRTGRLNDEEWARLTDAMRQAARGARSTSTRRRRSTRSRCARARAG